MHQPPDESGVRAVSGEADEISPPADVRRRDPDGPLQGPVPAGRPAAPPPRLARAMKRGVDIFVSLAGLIVLAPLMAVIALTVRLTMGSPVIFRQQRPGIHERPFTILKFRSMRDVIRSSGGPPPDDERLTRIGAFLRTTSLDELPELWNVLKGDMSLVGPRPLLVRYTPYFTPRERLRMEVRPGITGWAQVNGRNLSSWDDRLENDVWYVEHWSLRLDARILALTLRQVVSRSGVVVDARSVMLNLDEERASTARE